MVCANPLSKQRGKDWQNFCFELKLELDVWDNARMVQLEHDLNNSAKKCNIDMRPVFLVFQN